MLSSRRVRRGVALSASLLAAGLAVPAVAGAAVPSAQTINTVAGDGATGSAGDGGPAVRAQLNRPSGVAEGINGALYISDRENNKVRKVVSATKINADIISTFAGTGVAGFAGDGGPATKAELQTPTAVAINSSGAVFIADTGNNRIREVLPTGRIVTFAGNGAPCGNGSDPDRIGDGGPATKATLCHPTGVAVGRGGDVYVSDTVHSEVRVIGPGGIIRDFAGGSAPGYRGDGGPATRAQLSGPTGLAVDAGRHVFIADTRNTVVREVDAGTITTFAGNGTFGFGGDGGPASRAKLAGPTGVGVDQSGNVYIADTVNERIRMVDGRNIISTFAGSSSTGFSGDGGPATKAQLEDPRGQIAASGEAVYFSDTFNQRVRAVFNGPAPILPEAPAAILLPLGGAALLGAGFVLARRRRRPLAA